MASNEESLLTDQNNVNAYKFVDPKIECEDADDDLRFSTYDTTPPVDDNELDGSELKNENGKRKMNGTPYSLRKKPKKNFAALYPDLVEGPASGHASDSVSFSDDDASSSSSDTDSYTKDIDPDKLIHFTCADLERTDDGGYKCLACPYTYKNTSSGVVQHMAYKHPQYVYNRLLTKKIDEQSKVSGLGLKKWTDEELSDPNKKLEYTTSDLERVNLKYKCLCCTYTVVTSVRVHEHIAAVHPKFVRKPWKRQMRVKSGLGIKTWTSEELADPKKQLKYTTANLERADDKYKCFECPYESTRKPPIIAHIRRYHPRFFLVRERDMPNRDNQPLTVTPGTKIWSEEDISDPNKKLVYTSRDLKQPNGTFKCFCCSFETKWPVDIVRHISSHHSHPRLVFQSLRRSTIHRRKSGKLLQKTEPEDAIEPEESQDSDKELSAIELNKKQTDHFEPKRSKRKYTKRKGTKGNKKADNSRDESLEELDNGLQIKQELMCAEDNELPVQNSGSVNDLLKHMLAALDETVNIQYISLTEENIIDFVNAPYDLEMSVDERFVAMASESNDSVEREEELRKENLFEATGLEEIKSEVNDEEECDIDCMCMCI